jgi:hypothetical protein
MDPDSDRIETRVFETWKRPLQLGGLKLLRLLRGTVRAVADSLTKKLFLAAFEAADNAYWRRHATQCEWRSLGGIIEYTPDLLAVPGARGAPVYLIAIRAKANSDLERVVVKIKAKKSGVIHEQQIRLDHLCTIPVRKALTALPLQKKSSKGAGGHKLGDLYIKLTEAVDRDGVELVEGKKIAQIFLATGADFLSLNQVERWGQYWNIDAINLAIENIKARYYRELVQSARRLGRPLKIRRAAYRLLGSQLGSTLTFWSKNLGTAEGIRISIAQAEDSGQPIANEKHGIAKDCRDTASPAVSSAAAGSRMNDMERAGSESAAMR